MLFAKRARQMGCFKSQGPQGIDVWNISDRMRVLWTNLYVLKAPWGLPFFPWSLQQHTPENVDVMCTSFRKKCSYFFVYSVRSCHTRTVTAEYMKFCIPFGYKASALMARLTTGAVRKPQPNKPLWPHPARHVLNKELTGANSPHSPSITFSQSQRYHF